MAPPLQLPKNLLFLKTVFYKLGVSRIEANSTIVINDTGVPNTTRELGVLRRKNRVFDTDNTIEVFQKAYVAL